MPRGPRGEKRPAEVIGNAAKVGRLSVGLETEELREPIRSGHPGVKARAESMSKEERTAVARNAAAVRWGGHRRKAEVYQMTPNVPRIIEAILAVVCDAEKRAFNVTQYDIVKTLFLADRAHLNNYGRPITFDNYVAMLHGPVPSLAYNFLKENRHAMGRLSVTTLPWSRATAPELGHKCFRYFNPARAVDEDVLSPSDMQELTSALTIVLSLGFGQIRKLTHEDPAYVDAWEDGVDQRSFPMSYALLFDAPNFDLAKELSFFSEHV